MSSSVLNDLLKDLRERAEHNKTRPDYKVKPDSESAIISTVLKLADEFEKLEARVGKLDEKVSLAPGAKRIRP